jgi:hypothetical protein
MKLGMYLFQHNIIIMEISKTFCFGLTLEKEKEPGQTKPDW